tara:strand:- start:34 stop:369 length:336 start_codon:yes stop_codon:yes gene_type:complete
MSGSIKNGIIGIKKRTNKIMIRYFFPILWLIKSNKKLKPSAVIGMIPRTSMYVAYKYIGLCNKLNSRINKYKVTINRTWSLLSLLNIKGIKNIILRIIYIILVEIGWNSSR